MSSTSATTETAGRGRREGALLANAWLALTEAFAPPGEWPDHLEERLAVAFAPVGGAAAEAASALSGSVAAARRNLDAAAVAHARLFVGPYGAHAPPYESHYRDPRGRLMGEVSQQVAAAYAEAGLVPREGPRDAPDHLLSELEFMYYLRLQEASVAAPPWGERRRRFWGRHLSRWLPRVVASMRADPAPHPVYRDLARLAHEVVALEAAAEPPPG